MPKELINVNSYDFSEYREDQFVIFDSHIRQAGPMSLYAQALKQHPVLPDQVIDCQSRLLLPALVICHTHIYSSFARGMSLPFAPDNFLQLLEQLWWKLDAGLTREMIRSSARVASLGYVQNGVGTVIDHHASGADIAGTLDELHEALIGEAGLRGLFCFECSDRFPLEECISENLRFLSEYGGAKAGHFGLHASMTLSDESLAKVARVLDGRPIHIHVAESKMDQDDSLERYGKRVIQRLDEHRLITPDSLLVHGIYLDESELDIIARRGAYLVVNPSSNMNNAVGLPNVPAALERGIPVLLGNDGMSYGVASEWMQLYLSMHHRTSSPLGFSLDDLNQIVQNGYEYINKLCGTRLGDISAGAEADFLLLDYSAPTPISSENAFGHLLFGSAAAFRPRDLWAGGERLLEENMLRGDQEAIYSESRNLSARLWERIS